MFVEAVFVTPVAAATTVFVRNPIVVVWMVADIFAELPLVIAPRLKTRLDETMLLLPWLLVALMSVTPAENVLVTKTFVNRMPVWLVRLMAYVREFVPTTRFGEAVTERPKPCASARGQATISPTANSSNIWMREKNFMPQKFPICLAGDFAGFFAETQFFNVAIVQSRSRL